MTACTCPSGDGSLRWPCPAHPAEQQGELVPVAWRTFDGEGGYDYRAFDENENYAEEWAKRNPNHKGWVDALYTADHLLAKKQAEREPHGWIVWWPAMGGGHKPVYSHGPTKPNYGPELGAKLRLYPVFAQP